MITKELVVDYVFRILLPFAAAWFLALLVGKPSIEFLKKLRARQTEREDGPESHKVKNGTPTMGGIIFLIPMVIVTLLFLPFENADAMGVSRRPEMIAVLIPTVGFGLIGFLDDRLKVARHKNLGLRAWQKLALQFVVTLGFAAFLHFGTEVAMEEMILPFTGGKVLAFGIFTVPALIFIALAVTNGSNLTDGVDGLCASVTIPVALFFAIAALLTCGPAAPAAAAMAGALLGYLFYNFYPAKVFMGDTGSLAIGGFVLGMSYVLSLQLFIPIAGFIYALEALSVLLQVGYFKATHGKRLFRMAPIHHHFEKGGWSETRVVGIFTAITILLSMLALAGISPAL